MPIAFVMITTEIGTEEEVRLALKKLEGVEEAYSIYVASMMLAFSERSNSNSLPATLLIEDPRTMSLTFFIS